MVGSNTPSEMVSARIPTDSSDVNAAVLGDPLNFVHSGRQASNRFLKVWDRRCILKVFQAALTERISTWDATDLAKRGIPTQRLINLYEKWGNGGFGVILTGNVMADPVSPCFLGITLCSSTTWNLLVMLSSRRKQIHPNIEKASLNWQRQPRVTVLWPLFSWDM